MDNQAELDEWLRRFDEGKIFLHDAIYFFLKANNAPEQIMGAYLKAIQDYQDGKFSDLAEPFGMASSKRKKQEMNKLTLESSVIDMVDAFHDRGFKRSKGVYSGDTAFDKAAEIFNRSASRIHDIYYDAKRKRAG